MEPGLYWWQGEKEEIVPPSSKFHACGRQVQRGC